MNSGFTSAGNMRNVIYQSTGRILSLNNIRYLCHKLNEDTQSHDELLLQSLSSVDQMIEYFRKKGFEYFCLLHTVQINIENIINGVTTDTYVNRNLPEFIYHCSPAE